jgi:hypothetical protein
VLDGDKLIEDDDRDDESEDELRIVPTDSLLLSAVTDEDEQVRGERERKEREKGKKKETLTPR